MLNLLPGIRPPSDSAPHSAHSSDESSLKAIGASCLAEHHGAWSKIKKKKWKKKEPQTFNYNSASGTYWSHPGWQQWDGVHWTVNHTKNVFHNCIVIGQH